MAELGQRTVKFSTLVSRAAEESFQSLKELVAKSKSSDLSDTEKKIGLLKYIVKTQQRMLRLNVLAKWCQQVPLIQYCQQLASTLSSHDTCFTQTADSLFFMHEGLQQARAPIYDVPSAIEVLLTGTYERLPKCVEDIGTQSSLSESQQMPALKKLDTLVRSKLLEISIPKEISMVKITNGTALLRVDGEFEVLVTLGYRGHLSLWRILHLDLLVGERNGPVKLEELRRLALGDELERRMAAAENPFMILYSVLHEFCVALIMDTVIRQILALRQGRWKDAIRFELISDGSSGQGNAGAGLITHDGELESTGQRTPGAKLSYWLDLEKNSSSSDSGSSPFLKIEPGSDLQIKCVHSSFVIDPSTGKEAEFVLDRSCIDVEKLLLKAICGNRYTRLLEIHKDLMKSGHIYRAPGDVSLQHCMTEVDFDHEKKHGMFHGEESEGQKVLGVRAYGSSFFILGINLRNGRFLLQTSRNILSPSVLVDAAEALNQGSISAAEVFATLRSKSILHLFAYIGKFLGLQVYEQGFAAEKVPKELLNGSNFLLMGCRDESSSYFILMQPNKDFKPLFKMIETRSQFSKSSVLDIVRMKDINIDHLQIMQDELSSSIVDWGKAVKGLAGAGLPGESLEHDLLSNFNLEALVHKTGCAPSSFASVVDEVFGHDEGTPVTYCGSGISSSFTELHALETTTIDAKPQRVSDGLSPPKGRGIIQHTSSIGCDYKGSLYQGSNPKGLNQLNAADRQTSTGEKLYQSKSDQDLASLRSPLTVEAGSLRSRDEDHLTLLNGSSREASTSGRSTHTLSDMLPGGAHSSSLSGKINGLGSSPIRPLGPSINYLMSNSVASNPVSHTEDCAIGHNTQPCRNSRKRRVSDVLNMLPSLLGMDVEPNIYKRRKTMSDITPSSLTYTLLDRVCQPRRYSYGRLISEANRGNAPSTAYIAVLLHVVRHCSLCVKHARLTSQMEILHIEYNEEASVGDAFPNIWLRLPSLGSAFSWPNVVLRLGRSGTLCWDVKIKDQHFKDLWELQKGNNTTPWGGGIRIANTSDIDSHIYYDSEGVVLCYKSVEDDSIKNVVADIRRLSNARMFALGMRKLLGVKMEEKVDEGLNNDNKAIIGAKSPIDSVERLSEQMRKAFKIEAVGLMSLWFSFGSGSGVLARFVVEWESGKEGCTMHVSPDGLWPHTKFLEDFINGGEVASLLDCIRLTAGPLHALAAATRPARAAQSTMIPAISSMSAISKQSAFAPSQAVSPSSSIENPAMSSSSLGNLAASATPASALGSHGLHSAASMLAASARGGSGIVPSSLLPIDVSVVLRGPYWIRIIYRKNFAVDMRCFAGDQVWLQPATPPKGGPSVGGSLPCPQFRPFIMEHVAQELNGLEPNYSAGHPTAALANSSNPAPSSGPHVAVSNGVRANIPNSSGLPRPGGQVAGAIARMGNALSTASTFAAMNSMLPLRRSPVGGVPAHVRGELNTAIIGLGDDGGYGGGWVPLVALKKVLRGILKYLGVLWLFAQLPDLLKEILGSILKENEGALLNLDQEQPALRFFVGGYVFAVSVHRVQLLLQVLSVRRFNQQQQQQQNASSGQEELTQSEIGEICDYFSRRVASEPYDASRVASFITLLTLPISVLREFLKLITWKKSLAQSQLGDTVAPSQKPRIELCLENHSGLNIDGSSSTKSNVHYDRASNAVDFGLTVVLDSANIPHANVAGGAGWLPYCVLVRLRYSFGDNSSVTFLGMKGSHGGRACWFRASEWENCKQTVSQNLDGNGFLAGDVFSQGRLRVAADSIQKALHLCLQGLRDGHGGGVDTGGSDVGLS